MPVFVVGVARLEEAVQVTHTSILPCRSMAAVGNASAQTQRSRAPVCRDSALPARSLESTVCQSGGGLACLPGSALKSTFNLRRNQNNGEEEALPESNYGIARARLLRLSKRWNRGTRIFRPNDWADWPRKFGCSSTAAMNWRSSCAGDRAHREEAGGIEADRGTPLSGKRRQWARRKGTAGAEIEKGGLEQGRPVAARPRRERTADVESVGACRASGFRRLA